MIYAIQINVKYDFHKNYQAHKLFKGILYIPGGWDRERIDMSDLKLPSNHNRSFTGVLLYGLHIYDMSYLKDIITFVVYNTKLKCYEVGSVIFY